MKRVQVLVLLLSATAGLAAMAMTQIGPAAPSAPVHIVPAPPVATSEILVAAADLPLRSALRPEDLRWQPWPAELVPAGAIVRDQRPNAAVEFSGMMTRTPFASGEPLRVERIAAVERDAGYMATALPSGMRAVAVPIDTRGLSSAGGFVQPNDRVDVIRVHREEDRQGEAVTNAFQAETILANVRVLAIGQQLQTNPDGTAMQGETATLEVSPEQAEAIALAQRMGHLTLSLRSFSDWNLPESEPAHRPVVVTAGGSGGFATARFVIAQDSAARDRIMPAAVAARSPAPPLPPARPSRQPTQTAQDVASITIAGGVNHRAEAVSR